MARVYRLLALHQTDAEKKLWSVLRARKLRGAKFRRQQPMGRYFLDFYCVEHRLAIEADGGQHYTDEGRSRDEQRTQELERYGVRVLRFSDREILLETESVIAAIHGVLYPGCGPSP